MTNARIRPTVVACALFPVATLLACQGNIGDDKDPAALPPEASVGPTDLRRLSKAEYAATVEEVLGVDPSSALLAIPEDDRTTGFDNAGVTQTLSALHASGYFLAAKKFSAEVIADASLRDKVIGCDPSGSERAACLDDFVTRFGRRMFRRPLSDDEKQALRALADTETDGLEAAARVIEAALQSPSFLWRPEIGTPDAELPIARLDGYEVATRLAFFLTGRGPDDALLDLAAEGALDDGAGVEKAVRSMLADERTRESMHHFVAQWFGVDRLPSLLRDPEEFPEYDVALVDAMAAEATQLIDDHMFGEEANLLEVYTAPYGYADAGLAALYGLQGGGDELVRVELADDANRGGLLGTAAFLTASTRHSWTSAVQRGVFVRQRVFCDAPPPPPPNIPPLELGNGQDPADAEEAHMAVEPCKTCHASIDPIGWGLERYDAIGKLRETYPSGNEVRQEGTIVDIDGVEDQAFAGARELGAIAATSEGAASCAVKQTFRFALGRTEYPDDAYALETIGTTFTDADNNFTELVVALTTSHAFLTRRTQ